MSDPTPEDLFGRLLGKQDQTINVQMGGSGVWIASTAAVVCVVSVMFLAAVVAYLAYKVENQSMQLNAIYMMAPHLKPED